ncbi:MAG: yxcA [Ignavibacteria bacterium]|nr:yxcA [Ignavibacteria bacterium]
MNNCLSLGVDIGSTTAKAAIINSGFEPVFTRYLRHNGKIKETTFNIIDDVKKEFGNISFQLAITGSAGLGICESYGLPFVQELIASKEYIDNCNPEVNTLLDIGGEDSKMIFFGENRLPDIRMNTSCAGGTGSFIDQLSNLLDISLDKLNEMAFSAELIHPIASRCGVFAKTDVQNLISREIPKNEIAASIFQSLALQVKNTLLRGSQAVPKILFSGGPLTFLSYLKKAVLKSFGLEPEQVVNVNHPELIASFGAAITGFKGKELYKPDLILRKLIQERNSSKAKKINKPLFTTDDEYKQWLEEKKNAIVSRIDLSELHNKPSFLGIDSGSTTTKLVLIDENGKIAFDYYAYNKGNPIAAVAAGFDELRQLSNIGGIDLLIRHSTATGYGEDLIRTAFNLSDGIIETLAHWRSASHFSPDVSFILDIGGQDMKAIFVKDGIINNIEINEACSSGCGTFIDAFAHSLNFSTSQFGQSACLAGNPSELGSRCTVFMNSKVKQSFRDGSQPDDIAAGLAYSVIENCIHKVLRIHDKELLGENIVAQGGTFSNDAVLRALEIITDKKITRPDISGMMGAYGAALYALDTFRKKTTGGDKSTSTNLELLTSEKQCEYQARQIQCKGCENNCQIKKLSFLNGNNYFTGNRCDKNFANHSMNTHPGFNFPAFKMKLLFERKTKPDNGPIATVYIPRVLNIYENFPFWASLFVECGIEVKLSSPSSKLDLDGGSGTVMSDNICYPAKLAHSHFSELLENGADRIFYPMVTFEEYENCSASNSFNCPVITGYPDVLRSAFSGKMEPRKANAINSLKLEIDLKEIHSQNNNPNVSKKAILDSPFISFKIPGLTKKACYTYLKQFDVTRKTFNRAFSKAITEQRNYRLALIEKGSEIIQKAKLEKRKIIILAGRPYHIDNIVNRGIPDMITSFGIDVLTDDCLPCNNESLSDVQVLTQWAYPNRLIKAAKFSAGLENCEFVHLNSFGCGPDTIIVDEVKEILESKGRLHTLIRIDEHTAPGSLRLRIRSLIESVKLNESKFKKEHKQRQTVAFLEKNHNRKTIIFPHFSKFHSSYSSAPFVSGGYNVQVLPPPDEESVKLGLQYVNNEICYPATLLIGDILKALQTGNYDLSDTFIAISQTAGQCRASNYLSLLKKAMVKAGFRDVPVVSISLAKKFLNEQPGFKINKKDITLMGILGMLFGDFLASMYYSTAPREANKGESSRVADKYLLEAAIGVRNKDVSLLTDLLKRAVSEFNSIPINKLEIPKVGIVGEVYVKYNSMGNAHLVERLLEDGIEVVMPPLINIFIQWFVNVHVKQKQFVDKKLIASLWTRFLEKYYNHIYNRFDHEMSNFRFYRPFTNIRELAEKAEPFSSLITHYFGEGWMIAGDIAVFAEEGINNVLCMQPFGCIANHIVARGIEKSLKERYPALNLLFLDIDSGVSEVNLHNRLHLLMNK